MNPDFVSQFPREYQIEQELYRYLYLTAPMIVAVFIILGVVLVVNLVSVLLFGLLYANMAIFAMCGIVLFVMFFRYFSAIKTSQARFAEDTNNKGIITVTATICDGKLISGSSDREKPIEVACEHFKKAFETKHYYWVYTDDKMVYTFKKGAFSVGREEDFLPYIGKVIENKKRKK
ncbi:MAG: hypothetical protein U0L60_03945 [Ruminococcus sp.]|nr:hypothetical protein [Ruminococcus sp.]